VKAMDRIYDPAERKAEKQRSREEDERALAAGEKRPEDLRRENALLRFSRAEVRLKLGR
jgi:hypothetical protein